MHTNRTLILITTELADTGTMQGEQSTLRTG
jgi:hypothetical protein